MCNTKQNSLDELLPHDKFETDKAEAIVRLGFPRIEPILSSLLEWMQDINWPVARVLHPFLLSIGLPLCPYIKDILRSRDACWKYCILQHIVQHSHNLSMALKEELLLLVKNPSKEDIEEGIDIIATAILSQKKHPINLL